jgi:hypothetical protein
MFLTGFIFGSIIVYLICLQEKLLPAYGNAGTLAQGDSLKAKLKPCPPEREQMLSTPKLWLSWGKT